MTVYYLSKEDYNKTIKPHWWGRARAWTDGVDVYINKDAFYIDQRDRQLILEHELEHINGKNHTNFGVMSPYGLVRWLTSW